jgi:hypothetical protein
MSPPADATPLPMQIRYSFFSRRRGRRLGLRLKLAMLDLLVRQEPQMQHILTSNGETNMHMISINETLGYYRLGKPARSWELPAARAGQVKGTGQS